MNNGERTDCIGNDIMNDGGDLKLEDEPPLLEKARSGSDHVVVTYFFTIIVRRLPAKDQGCAVMLSGHCRHPH